MKQSNKLPGLPGTQARPPRYNVSLSAIVTYRTASGEKSVTGQIRSINKNGMALFVPKELPIGVPIQLALPRSQEWVFVRAVIRNREQFTYGIAFLNTPEQERAVQNPSNVKGWKS